MYTSNSINVIKIYSKVTYTLFCGLKFCTEQLAHDFLHIYLILRNQLDENKTAILYLDGPSHFQIRQIM